MFKVLPVFLQSLGKTDFSLKCFLLHAIIVLMRLKMLSCWQQMQSEILYISKTVSFCSSISTQRESLLFFLPKPYKFVFKQMMV